MLEKVTYTCGKCGWSKSLTAMWQDIKPKKCPRSKCKTSFVKDPQILQISLSKQETPVIVEETEMKEEEVLEEKVVFKEYKKKNK